MTNRPYSITAVRSDGFSTWAGRRTRTFATVDAARQAAFKLAATIAEVNPHAAVVEIRFTNGAVAGPLVESVEVEVI